MDLIDIAADVIRERDQLEQRGRELEDYYKARVATAEEKVKEWSVRACEAEERIRKLENMLSGLLIHGQPKGELEERIAKAKAILEDGFRQTSNAYSVDLGAVRRALAALEGK